MTPPANPPRGLNAPPRPSWGHPYKVPDGSFLRARMRTLPLATSSSSTHNRHLVGISPPDGSYGPGPVVKPPPTIREAGVRALIAPVIGELSPRPRRFYFRGFPGLGRFDY